MTALADQAARDAIRRDLDATLIVEAAAGTGKTTELVNRVMALLTQGKTTLARLVAVTFTEKAAGEMKLRLRGEIEKARRDAGPDVMRRLDLALAELEEAHIGTIHGFCAEVLRQRPVEARVDPLFEAADEDQQGRMFDEAMSGWFQTVLEDPPEGVRRLLRHKPRGWDRVGARELLRRAGFALVQQRDFDAPWRRDPFDRDAAIDDAVARITELGRLAARAENKTDWAAQSIAEVERVASEIERREAVRGRDHDGLEEELRSLARQKFWGWKGKGKWFAPGLARDDVLRQRQATKDALDALLERCDADLAACLREDLRPLVSAYEALKRRAGKLDFLDLLLVTRNLVRDDASVRRELQVRYTHILVDEFQDTDPLQAEILLLLASDDPDETDHNRARAVAGKLFVVGDPKQSIYRFRRADVALYESIKKRLIAQGATLLHLTTSFRSAPSIQAAVNAAFAPKMKSNPEGSQAEYVALAPFRTDPEGRPTVVALPVPRPYSDYGRIAGFAVDRSLPDAVGAFVDWLLTESGWSVTERERPGERVPLQARHVCLLTRRFVTGKTDVTRDYVRALEARRIPHVLVGGRSFFSREEVTALKNALSAIEWPDDELSVFATLRGPFFALGDDALLLYRHRALQKHRGLHPLLPLETAELDALTAPIADALAILRRLHHARNKVPIADTVARFLDETRAHAGVAIWPTGEQALANLLRVVDQARRCEAAGATSFRAFVEWLEEESERGNAAEAPVVEEGTDGVRIMTVFKAKGLEFPVVILIDPTCAPTLSEPSRYVDPEKNLFAMPLAGRAPKDLVMHRDEVLKQDAEEALRLLYVAATRARELLVVPVVGDEPLAGWVDALHPILYPDAAHWRTSSPAPGCPRFGSDSVLARPDSRDPDGGVRPGLHRSRAGTPVVWWDPGALRLDRSEEAGLRQQKILAADQTGGAAAESEKAHERWQSRRKKLLADGSVPSLRVLTVTESLEGAPRSGAPVRVEATEAALLPRPRGARFGRLVHGMLEALPFESTDAEVSAMASVMARMLEATDEEKAAAVVAVTAARAHPLLVQAKACGAACRREAPVLFVDASGNLVEGVLDLAFRTADAEGKGHWVVVDYKTDADIEGRREEYEAQVRAYVQAVARATGESASGVLLRV